MSNESGTHKDTIVIGAGPAGLAVGACLKRAGIPCVILEGRERVGAAWHHHYDRLHLHTDKGNSELPFLPYPQNYPRYPSRSQVIEYLEAYAQKFQLEIKFGQQVNAAQQARGQWEARTQDVRYDAPNLVVATGYNHEPFIPRWQGQDSFRGTIIHSSEYKNGAPFTGQNVLVVGFGNSGGEIAIDLWEHGARPSIAVRSPVNVIPRELFGIPILSIGILQRKLPPKLADALNAILLRAVIGDLTRYGLRKQPYGPMTQIQREARIPLIDVGTIQLIKEGRLAVYPGIEAFTREGVRFKDGKEVHFDAVILATGYRPRIDAFLQADPAPYDRNGTPLSSGRRTSLPGLYFCGFFVSPAGMLREIGIEARQISAAIAGKKT